MKKFIFACCVVAGAVGVLLWRRRAAPKLGYIRFNVLSRDSTLEILDEIRDKFNTKYYPLLLHSRRTRRQFDRNSTRYKNCIKELCIAAKQILEEAYKSVLSNKSITAEELETSVHFYQDDPQVASAAQKICSPIPSKSCKNIRADLLREILIAYINLLNQETERDSQELVYRMQMNDDQLYVKFNLEKEEIEQACAWHKDSVIDLILEIKKLNGEMISEATGVLV
jgi:hypothetical protein